MTAGRASTTARWRAALTLAALLAGTGCDSLPGRPREEDRPLRPSEIVDFAALWGSNCAGCHGTDGRNGSAAPLAEPAWLAAASDASIRAATANGIPGTQMPAFAASQGGMLTDRQVDVIVAGMRARWAKPVEPAPPSLDDATVGDAARGAAVFAARCASCHGTDGAGAAAASGGVGGGSVVDPAYLALVSDRGLRVATIVGRPDFRMPDWRGESGKDPLDAQQVADVVAWMSAKRPARAPAAPGTASAAAPTRSDHVP